MAHVAEIKPLGGQEEGGEASSGHPTNVVCPIQNKPPDLLTPPHYSLAHQSLSPLSTPTWKQAVLNFSSSPSTPFSLPLFCYRPTSLFQNPTGACHQSFWLWCPPPQNVTLHSTSREVHLKDKCKCLSP